MKRKMLSWVNRPWAMELLPGMNTVGRNPTNSIRVSDASVSSFHCEIIWEDDVVTVMDLASTNGTFIDGQLIQEAVLMKDQVLKLGQIEFNIEDVETQEAAPEPPSPSKEMVESVTEIIPKPVKQEGSLLGRLTQTLRMPFGK